jgi:O-antigen ligase
VRSLSVGADSRPGPDRRVLVAIALVEVSLVAFGFLLDHPLASTLVAAGIAYFLLAYRYPDAAWILVWVTVPPNMEVLLGTGTAITVPTEPMMILALLAWILRGPPGRMWNIPRSPLHLPLAALSALVLISATWSLNPVNTLKAWVMMGGYVLFGYVYFLRGDCNGRRRERWLLISALTGAVWGLFGIIRVLFTGGADRALTIASTYSYGAFRPFFREHGTYSAYLGMLLPAALLFSMERKGRGRIVYGFSAFLIGCGVILAFARAGWLAVVSVVPLAALAWAQRHREGRRLLIPALAVLLVTLLTAISGISAQVTHHAETTVSAENLSNLERFNRWTAALAMTRDHPWTGVGFGSYLDAYRAYRGKSIVTDQAFLRMGTHSEPLKLLSELGIPGFLAAAWFLLAVFRLGWRAFRNLTDREDRVLALAALAGLATYVVNGLFNSYLVEDKVTIPFWSAIGVIAALGRRLEKDGQTLKRGPTVETPVRASTRP